MTQVVFVASGTAQNTTNGSVNSLAFPAGITDGDLLIAVIFISAPARTYTAPAGWSTTVTAQNTSTNGPTIHVSTRVYVSGDTAPTFTAGGTSLPGAGVTARMLAYRNAGTSVTLGTTYTSGATTGTSVGSITGVSVTGLGLALSLGAWSTSWTSAPSTPSGWTSDDTQETTASTVNIAAGVFEIAVNNTTSASVTIVGNTTAATRVGVQIAIPEGAASAFSGTVALSGSGTVAPTAGTVTTSGAVALSGVGTDIFSSALMSAAGTLGTSGSGTLTATGSAVYLGAVGLSGAGTLSATGVRTGVVGLSGAGALSFSGAKPTLKGTVGLTASGSLGLTGIQIVSGSVRFGTIGTLATSAGKPKFIGAVGLSSTGTLVLRRSVPVYQWNGTAWMPLSIVTWNGTAWVATTMKLY